MTLHAITPAERLSESLEKIKVGPMAVVRLLAVLDSPSANTASVAGALEADPKLTAHIMKLANSAFYGLSGRVKTVSMAVSVVGFSATRSMATLAAAGLADPDASVPPGFWDHTAAAAAAASLLAPMLSIPKGEAFAAALLHDLGLALIHQAMPEFHRPMVESYGTDTVELARAEAERFGMAHDEAAGMILQSWHFPDELTTAIAGHHQDDDEPSPLGRLVRLADRVAIAVSNPASFDAAAMGEELGIEESEMKRVVLLARQNSADVAGGLPRSRR
jgi:HD-like signal output (HDOD) protein